MRKTILTALLGCSAVLTQLNSGCTDREQDPAENAASIRCGRASADPDDGDLLAWARYGMVATWRGTATTPWVPPYTVEIAFAADGTYDAHTVDHSSVSYPVPPLYYGDDPVSGVFELVDLHSNGEFSGKISIDPTQSADSFDAVRFNEDLTHLHFEYSHRGYGPIVYELDCGPS